jgi:DNA polymerase sigma
LRGSPYAEGLDRIETFIQKIATDHKLPVFGSYNPHTLGCTSDMYIDAEHANDKCLKKIFDQFMAIDATKGAQ